VNRFFTSAVLFFGALVALAPAREPDWALSLPGWRYEFPRDHFSHPDFKTEWWYFTGNLTAADGRQLGFQLTFFRQGVQRGEETATRFAVEDIKLAHFAVTDITGGTFRFAQKVSRGSFGEAGFSDGARIAWIDDWVLHLTGPGRFRLEARADQFALALDLTAKKEPVFHGEGGVSRKAEGEGRASHYYSFTRLAAEGTVTMAGRVIPVQGLSWFDQEWATNQLTENQRGWDWLSLQFEDNTELMLFQIRLKDGGRDPFSHGTWIDADGNPVPVKNGDFELVPGRSWRSEHTGGDYPVEWKLRIPKLDLELEVTAAMDAQELVLQPIAYWEGSVRGQGKRDGQAVSGRGYLEMTGYAGGLVGLQAPDTR
jgi:predicted secreted hydrolase